MEIRTATEADIPVIVQCVNEAFEGYIPAVGKKPAPMLLDYRKVIQEDFAFVAVVDGTVGGIASVRDTNDDYMWLDVLAVFRKHKGLGLGKALIRHAEALIVENGKPECRIYTNAKFEDSIEIYKYLGYAEYQRKHEDGYDRVFLKRALSG
jgi:predicted N-acetyltransferase YhbS